MTALIPVRAEPVEALFFFVPPVTKKDSASTSSARTDEGRFISHPTQVR